ncbi:MAG: hypothetical protein OYK82_04255 [Gammaproteobacteria bacterium]|nr:hypothetical protein [Gammaproteobacteria bacterium]
MAHRVDPGRTRGRVRALTGIAAALSFLLLSVVEASHSHTGAAESAAACSVCQLGKRPGHTTASYTPGPTGPNLLQAPAIAGHRAAPADLHLSPHRSRAPPVGPSL